MSFRPGRAGVICAAAFLFSGPRYGSRPVLSNSNSPSKGTARTAGYTIVRLPWAVAPLFTEWLERHAPGHKDKVLSRIESMRGGKLYDSRWGVRMKGEGIFAEQIKALFAPAKRKAGFPGEVPEISTAAFRVPTDQLSLF